MYWTYAGVNLTIPGAGGSSCIHYLSSARIITESIVIIMIFITLSIWSFRQITVPNHPIHRKPIHSTQRLLAILSLVFGVELGYKLATSSLIWLLNPCHILTLLQLFMLTSNQDKSTTFLYRLQMHMLNGPLLALALPVLNTRLLPCEGVIYFVQHGLLLLVPVALLDQSSAYSVEAIDDLSWVVFSLSLQVLYHFVVLQPIALFTGVNLNHIMCPAVSDPFKGPYFRVAAMVHQPFLVLVLGKCISCFGLFWRGQRWPWLATQVSSSVRCITMLQSSSYKMSLTSLWSNEARLLSYILDPQPQTECSKKDTSCEMEITKRFTQMVTDCDATTVVGS